MSASWIWGADFTGRALKGREAQSNFSSTFSLYGPGCINSALINALNKLMHQQL